MAFESSTVFFTIFDYCKTKFTKKRQTHHTHQKSPLL